MAKWYAVMLNDDDDDWGVGSFDLDEAKQMLWEQGDGHIDVVEDENGVGTYCYEQISWDDSFYYPNMETDKLAYLVAHADSWDRPHVVDVMEELCDRAGKKLRDMPDDEERQEFLDEIRDLAPEFLEDTPDVSAEQIDLIDFIRNPEQAEWLDIARVIQDILGIDLV